MRQELLLAQAMEPKRTSRPAFSAKSQGLVEFALILPVLLLTIFVIVELARVLHAWLAIENGARFGVRYAVTREYDSTHCTDADDDGVCDISSEEDIARLESIKEAAKAGAVAILRNESSIWNEPGYFKVNVCSSDKYKPPDPLSANPFGLCDPDEDPGEPGQFVSVTVDFNHPLITPMLTAVWPQLALSSRREAIVEEFRTSRVVDPPEGLPTLVPTNTFTITPSFTPSLTPTPSFTPTETYTPTPTPTPSCSNIIFVQDRINGDDFEIRVRNNNVAPAYLTSAYLEWTKVQSGMEVDKFRWDFNTYWGGNDSSSPTGPISSRERLNGSGTSIWWEVDFTGAPSPLWGTYSADLIFGFDDIGLTCPISGFVNQVQLPTNTPRPPTATNTPGPPTTPTNTRTPRPPTNTPGPATNTPKPTSTDPPATDTPPPVGD